MSDNPTTYFKGDLARYTGRRFDDYSIPFYEIRLLEGHHKGDLLVVTKSPAEALRDCELHANADNVAIDIQRLQTWKEHALVVDRGCLNKEYRR